ncbi:SPOR domain-containing protein [bacterium]|nr:SPOR domain-containing protein [bacterium]
MNKNQSEYEYTKRYKKQKNVTAQNILTVFTTTFLIMLVFFIGAAKHITPSVDVTIGEDSATDTKESGLGVKGFIDNRLKAIQSEDESALQKKLEEKANTNFEEEDDDNYFSKDLEEKVKIPSKKVKPEITVTLKNDETDDTPVIKPASAPQPKPTIQKEKTPVNTGYTPNIRVIVGSYPTMEQAKVAQSILQESNLGVSPFIKNVSGNYTLQVGSFTSEEKAQALADELLKHNFPARVVKN